MSGLSIPSTWREKLSATEFDRIEGRSVAQWVEELIEYTMASGPDPRGLTAASALLRAGPAVVLPLLKVLREREARTAW